MAKTILQGNLKQASALLSLCSLRKYEKIRKTKRS